MDNLLGIRTKPHSGVLAVAQFSDHGVSLVDFLADLDGIVESWDVHWELFFFEGVLVSVSGEEIGGCFGGWGQLGWGLVFI